jgi:pimeloyl-ACP methyl ester carboxylesterase
MGSRARWGTLVVLTAALVVPVVRAQAATSPAATTNPFPTRCSPPPAAGTPPTMVVGTVACQELVTHDLGNGVPAPFEYYVPPQCTATADTRCPVMYLLHGFGGDYTEMLGAPGTTTSAWVQAETKAPPAGFASAPWNYYDPTTWQPAQPAIPFILVAPLGQTLPGGYGPAPGMDSYWIDWNPRYAQGGDSERYHTPPPLFEQYVTQELPAFVESFLPAQPGRSGRAIAGVSLGGYGSFKLGLQHPDEYSSMLSVSGAMNFLFAPAPPAVAPTVPPAHSPIPIAYSPLPAVTGEVTSAPLPSQVGTFVTALDAFGDPAADQTYFRGNMPTDLAGNGHDIGINSFVNDMVPTPTRPEDASSEPFELIVFPMNMDMQADFKVAGVTNTFAVHQGNHSDVYRNAWFRGLEQFAYARTTLPERSPTNFQYRTISTDFTIWGWQFHGTRADTEFLALSHVTCRQLTISGRGSWTVTPPPSCHSKSFPVPLGPSAPADQPVPVTGCTVTVIVPKK